MPFGVIKFDITCDYISSAFSLSFTVTLGKYDVTSFTAVTQRAKSCPSGIGE